MGLAGQPPRQGVGQTLPLRRRKNDPGRRRRGRGPDGVHGGKERLWLHHHAGPAAVRGIVDLPVAVRGELTQIPHHDLQQSSLPGPTENAEV